MGSSAVADDWDEYLDVCDESNGVVGRERRDVCHIKGLKHRSVHVIISSSKDPSKILLQRRSQGKKLEPHKWDLSAAEHLKTGELYLYGAVRGLAEELGLQCDPRDMRLVRNTYFHQISYPKCGMVDAEFTQTWASKVDEGCSLSIDTSEVAEVKWWHIDEILQKLRENPTDHFAVWFINEMSHFFPSFLPVQDSEPFTLIDS